MKKVTLANSSKGRPFSNRSSYWKRLFKNIRKNYVLYLFLLPTLVWYVLFHYLPMGGIYVAFTRYKGVGDVFAAKFVGMKWFESFFKSRYIEFAIYEPDMTVWDVRVYGGCHGTSDAFGALCKGLTAEECIERLSGILCQETTSCPDQLAQALKAAVGMINGTLCEGCTTTH